MRCFMITRCCRSCTGYQWSSTSPTNWPSWPSRHVRHLCWNISVDISWYEVARGHCDRRPRHCCMSHSDELPSTNALSALQHHLSGTLSLAPFRTVTCLHYLNLDLKHICSPPSMLLNCPVRRRLWSHGNMALYKFCIVLYCFCICCVVLELKCMKRRNGILILKKRCVKCIACQIFNVCTSLQCVSLQTCVVWVQLRVSMICFAFVFLEYFLNI